MKRWSDKCYAGRILFENNLSLSVGDYPILYRFPEFNFPKLTSSFKVNDRDLLLDHELIQITYDQLKQFGFMISYKKPETKFRRYMRKQYYITRIHSSRIEMQNIPLNHYIKYNPKKEVVVLFGPNAGPNSVGSAVFVGTRSLNRKQKFNYGNPLAYMNLSDSNILKALPITQRIKDIYQDIPEIVLGRTDDGRIVCMPITFTDAPIIGWVGTKSFGKTMGVHRFIDQLKNKKPQSMFASMNDVNGERGAWTTCWGENDSFFLNQLALVNEPTVPLAMVHLHPNTNTLRDYMMVDPGENGFRISLPFDAMMRKSNYYFGLRPELKLKASLSWFRNILRNRKFFKQKSLKQILAFVDAYIPDKKDLAVRDKIKTMLVDIWSAQILDKSNNIPSKWTLSSPDCSKSYYPWEACMRAGIIPNIVTTDLQDKFYYQGVILFIYESIYAMQSLPEMKNNFVFIENDEMHHLMEDNVLSRLMNKVVLEGRMKRVGLIYVTQYYTKITQEIRSNTTHLFVLNQGSDELARKIIKDKDLSKDHLKILKKLKKFECLIIPKEGYNLIVYDVKTGEKENICAPIRVQLFPPNSRHSPPTRKEEK